MASTKKKSLGRIGWLLILVMQLVKREIITHINIEREDRKGEHQK